MFSESEIFLISNLVSVVVFCVGILILTKTKKITSNSNENEEIQRGNSESIPSKNEDEDPVGTGSECGSAAVTDE